MRALSKRWRIKIEGGESRPLFVASQLEFCHLSHYDIILNLRHLS